MTERVPVFVYAADPISQAGLASQLRSRPEVYVVDDSRLDDAAVAIVSADEIDRDTTQVIRAIQRDGCPRVIVIVARLDDAGLLAAVEAGACGLLRRGEAVPSAVAGAVLAAAKGD